MIKITSDRTFKYLLLEGDAKIVLQTLPSKSIHCGVTSPPYWEQRDYGVAGQLGREKTPEEYVKNLVEIMREVKRVLRNDGTFWLNIGDGYCKKSIKSSCLKVQDLVGIPWAVATALKRPYYSGNIKKELDRVWLAAIMDVEGLINGYTHVRKDTGEIRRDINIAITNSSVDLLNTCSRIWGKSKKKPYPIGKEHLGHLDIYRWVPNRVEDKILLLAELYPYLIAKKKQALLAWNLLQISKGARDRAFNKKNDQKCNWIVKNLYRLNHQNNIVIPDWMEEPESLLEDGWYLRSEVVWKKSNPMPESVKSRPSKSHEQLFLLSKTSKYFYDYEIIKEKQKPISIRRISSKNRVTKRKDYDDPNYAISGNAQDKTYDKMRKKLRDGEEVLCNKKDVWEVPTGRTKAKHFAAYPPELIIPCIKASSSSGGVCPQCAKPWKRISNVDPTIDFAPDCNCGRKESRPAIVLDPFNGSGTTAAVCHQLGRRYVGAEINPEYIEATVAQFGVHTMIGSDLKNWQVSSFKELKNKG